MTPLSTEKKPTVPRLRFGDYIRMFPPAWVFEHFLKKNDVSHRILSSDTVINGAKQFSRPESLRHQFESLDPQQRLQCSLVYLLGGSGLPVPEKGIDLLNDPLVRSFLVYAARNARGIVRYFGFTEFEPSLRTLCAKTIASAAEAKAPKGTAVSFWHGHCLNDLTVAAILAFQGVLEKKKQGGFTRKALLKLAKLTHAESGSLADLMVQCGLRTGILRENEKEVFCATWKMEEWLSRPAAARSAELLCFTGEFAGSWNLELLSETFHYAPSGWLSCRIFADYDRLKSIEILRMLRWAGLVELSRTGSESVFCAAQEKPSGKKNGAIVLQPDFSVVMPQEVPPDELFRFGHLGSLHLLDRVYKGSIERAQLNDSLASGMEGEMAVSWLTGWQAPSNVVATVREWIREFYRLYITEGPMLVTTDEKVSFEVGSYEPLREYLEPVPARALFRIKHGAVAAVKEILSTIGFDHRMPRGGDGRDGKESPGEPAIAEAWEPIAGAAQEPQNDICAFHGKKYGHGLKALDLNETMHVADYSMLTGVGLVIDYAGSPLIRKGTYTVTPVSCTKGIEPVLEGTDHSGRKRRFFIRKVSRIGVGAS